MTRIEKAFSDLDISKVDFSSGRWHYGRGGLPHGDFEWSISHISDDMTETRYKLPDCLSKMLNTQYSHGVDEGRLRERRSALPPSNAGMEHPHALSSISKAHHEWLKEMGWVGIYSPLELIALCRHAVKSGVFSAQ